MVEPTVDLTEARVTGEVLALAQSELNKLLGVVSGGGGVRAVVQSLTASGAIAGAIERMAQVYVSHVDAGVRASGMLHLVQADVEVLRTKLELAEARCTELLVNKYYSNSSSGKFFFFRSLTQKL
jgi:hypothetical protein